MRRNRVVARIQFGMAPAPGFIESIVFAQFQEIQSWALLEESKTPATPCSWRYFRALLAIFLGENPGTSVSRRRPRCPTNSSATWNAPVSDGVFEENRDSPVTFSTGRRTGSVAKDSPAVGHGKANAHGRSLLASRSGRGWCFQRGWSKRRHGRRRLHGAVMGGPYGTARTAHACASRSGCRRGVSASRQDGRQRKLGQDGPALGRRDWVFTRQAPGSSQPGLGRGVYPAGLH